MRTLSIFAFKNVAIAIVNVIIFYFLIGWLIENIRPQLLIEHMRRIPLAAVIPTIVINLIAMIFYGLRLGVLVNRPLGVSFQIVNLGFGFNAILPFRLGELARIYYARRFYALAATKLFAAAVVEKFCDLVALGGLVLVVLLFVGDSYIGKGVAVVLFGLILAVYVGVLIFRRYSHHAERWLRGRARLPALIAALRAHSRVHQLPRIGAYTIVLWLLNVGVVYLALAAFLPDMPLRVTDAIGMLLITALAIAIPSAPASLGVFEAGIVAYLTQVKQLENEPALAAAVVFHLTAILPQILIMGLTLIGHWRSGREVAASDATQEAPRSAPAAASNDNRLH